MTIFKRNANDNCKYGCKILWMNVILSSDYKEFSTFVKEMLS